MVIPSLTRLPVLFDKNKWETPFTFNQGHFLNKEVKLVKLLSSLSLLVSNTIIYLNSICLFWSLGPVPAYTDRPRGNCQIENSDLKEVRNHNKVLLEMSASHWAAITLITDWKNSHIQHFLWKAHEIFRSGWYILFWICSDNNLFSS